MELKEGVSMGIAENNGVSNNEIRTTTAENDWVQSTPHLQPKRWREACSFHLRPEARMRATVKGTKPG